MESKRVSVVPPGSRGTVVSRSTEYASPERYGWTEVETWGRKGLSKFGLVVEKVHFVEVLPFPR